MKKCHSPESLTYCKYYIDCTDCSYYYEDELVENHKEIYKNILSKKYSEGMLDELEEK